MKILRIISKEVIKTGKFYSGRSETIISRCMVLVGYRSAPCYGPRVNCNRHMDNDENLLSIVKETFERKFRILDKLILRIRNKIIYLLFIQLFNNYTMIILFIYRLFIATLIIVHISYIRIVV